MYRPRRTTAGALALALAATTAIVTTLGSDTRVAAGPQVNGNWVVDAPGDGDDADLGDVDCNDGGGGCTLRAALSNAAQQLTTADTTASIVFDAGSAPTIGVGPTITVDVPAGKTLQIIGPTLLIDRPVVSGAGQMLAFTGGGDVEISGVVFANGTEFGARGGAMSSDIAPGTLSLNRVTFDNNASAELGGALYAANDVVVTDSAFVDNGSGTGGNAIGMDQGNLTVTRTTFDTNTGGASNGGAIHVSNAASTVTITDSLFVDNVAAEAGAILCTCDRLDIARTSIIDNTADFYGGILKNGGTGFTLTDTTIVGNQATIDVNAAVYSDSDGVTFTNVTITGNTGNTLGTGSVGLLGPGTPTLQDSIIIGNLGTEGDCIIQNDPIVVGTNFLGASCALIGTPDLSNGTVNTSAPALEPIAPAGGVLTGVGDPLPVIVPAAGSTALDIGACATPLDGRALPRPATGCDIGAVERDPDVADGRTFTVDTPTDAPDAIVGDGLCVSVTGGCTLRAAIQEADATSATSTIEFAGAAIGPNPIQLPSSVCTTTTDSAFCGDLDIQRASLTIRGVDEPTAPRTGVHPVQISQLDDFIFDITAPSVVLEDLDIAGNSVERVIRATSGNTDLTIRDSRIANGWGIDASGPASATLTLDEVELENVDDSNLVAAIVTARTTTLNNSQIGLSDGGVLYSTDGALTITGTNIVDNSNISNGTPLIGCEAACGPVTVTDSTIYDNISPAAPVLSTGNGRATVENTTIASNTTVIGAIDVNAGGLDLRYSTITANDAGGSPGSLTGGLALGGAGPVTLENSIVSGNNATTGAGQSDDPDNCSGGAIVTLVGVNAFSTAGGSCTTIGDAPFTGTAFADPSAFLVTTPPRGESAWFEIATFPELDPSLIDSIPPDRCTGAPNPFVRGGAFADVRGMARPTGNGCEPGSIEVAVLSAGAVVGNVDIELGDLSIDDLEPVVVPTLVDGATDLSGAGSTEIRAIDLDATPLRQVPLRQVPLGALATDSELLDSISLSQLPLTYSSASGTGWPAYLTDQATTTNGLADLVDLPLNTVSLGQVVRALADTASDFGLPDLDISRIDFSETPLGALPIGALALGAASLTDIDGRLVADGGTDWCAIIAEYATVSCGAGQTVDPATASLVTISLLGVPLRQVPLRQVPLRQVDLTASPLRQVPLRQVEIGATPLRQVPLRQVLLEGSPLRQVPLRQVDLLGSPLRQVPLRQVLLEGSPLRQVPLRQVDLTASPLRQVPLRQVLLQDSPLRQVPLRQVDLYGSPLRQVPLRQVLIQGSPLRQVPLRQVDLYGSPLRQVPLRQVAGIENLIDCSVYDCVDGTIGDAFAGFSESLTLGQLVDAIDVGEALGAALDLDGQAFVDAFGDLTLGDLIDWLAATVELGTLGDIGGPEFPDAYGDELQGAAFTLEYLLLTLAADVDFGDLGDVDAALFPDVIGDLTLGELFDLITADAVFDETLLGDIGGAGYPDAYGDENSEILLGVILDILQQFFGPDATLGDLLAGILPASEYPWERVDLDDPANLDGAIAPTSFETDVVVSLPDATIVTANLTFPAGWRVDADSLLLGTDTLQPIAPTATSIVTNPDTGTTTVDADFELVRPAPGTLAFDATPPLDLVTTDPISVGLLTEEWSLVLLPVQSQPTTVRDAFEDGNDTYDGALGFGPDPESRLFLTHIGEPGDVDWFSLDIAQGTRLSAYLGNLPDDFDLLLYGPATTPLRGTPTSSVEPSPDGGLSLIGVDNATEAQIADDIDTTPPDASLRLYGSSTRRGVGDERIDTDALPAGTYYLRVSGFGDVSSASPYSLRVGLLESSISGVCAYTPGPTPTPPVLDPSVLDLSDPEINTLILSNLSRMARGYPDAAIAATAVEDLVTTVNADPARFGGVRAAVVPLDDIAAYTAWDADPCNPDAANAVVSAIGAEIDGILAGLPNVDNIVLIGADDQIPFARVVDAVPAHNESEYAIEFDGTSPLSAALSLGYVLSDNPYATATPIAVGPRELFVPELSVGRLVESPTDIATALDNFVEFDGRLDVSTALSTGYDFLSDGAEAVSDELVEPRGLVPATGLTELISDDWTRTDLRAALVDGAPDLASVNAHFDHYRALPADQDTAGVLTDPFVLDDVADALGDPLLGSVIFSMGCHSGLSVDDVSVGGSVQQDWAQTLSAEGAVFAGNTGYGYGDDTVVGATEELMRQFASRLDGSLTVGAAMAFAKQRYMADLLIVSPFDEKVVNQVVFYGLPMYRIGVGEPEQPIVNPPAVVDPVTGLEVFDTTLTPEATATTTDKGVYFETPDGYAASPLQPVQPKIVLDVTQPDTEARGAIITDLTTSDVTIDPVYVTPTDDTTTPVPEANVDGAIFPTVPQTISRYTDPNGERDQLVIVTGQFTDDPDTADGSGNQRLFDSVSTRVFYAPEGNTDTEPADIRSTSASVVGGSAVFEVVATDDAGIAQVLVLFTDADAPGDWTRVPLAPVAGTTDTYVGGTPAPAGVERVDYFVQVVDTGGLVAVSTSKGLFYQGEVFVPPPPPPTAPTIILPEPNPDGAYSGTVTATITPGTGGSPVAVRVDGGEPVFGSTVEVSGVGIHTVSATGPTGASAEVRFVISAPVLPVLDVTVSPDPAGSGWYTDEPTVTVSGDGFASITVDVDGVTRTSTTSPVVVGPLPDDDQTVVTYGGSTPAGTTVPDQLLTLRIDTTPPVIECGVTPTFILNADTAVVTATITDATSGVTVPTQSSPVSTAAAGNFGVEFSAVDVAGNSTTATCPFDVTYEVDGFFSPVDDGVTNRVKAGRAIPLKWRLTDADGNPIDDPGSFVGIGLVPGTCDGTASNDTITAVSTKSGLEYLGDGDWQYNWKTDKRQTGCVIVSIDLLGAEDAITAHFLLR